MANKKRKSNKYLIGFYKCRNLLFFKGDGKELIINGIKFDIVYSSTRVWKKQLGLSGQMPPQ